jgi:hypothetical protein
MKHTGLCLLWCLAGWCLVGWLVQGPVSGGWFWTKDHVNSGWSEDRVVPGGEVAASVRVLSVLCGDFRRHWWGPRDNR